MHDPGGVRFGEALGSLGDVGQERAQAGRLVMDPLFERDAFDQLHRDVVDRVCVGRLTGTAGCDPRFPDLVNGDDVGVVQRGRGARFLHEPPGALLIANEMRRQHLQRDTAAEHRVMGLIDLAHAARPEWADDLVVRDNRTRFDGALHPSLIRQHG
jgi:hypothetical protein